MTKNTAILSEKIGKKYNIEPAKNRIKYNTLKDSITKNLVRLFKAKDQDSKSKNTIWALKDVSFEVEQGEILGIIGRNGAGKSTLLKILSRITEPSEGYAEIFGRVGSLLGVGTGFHPELSGRENVFLSGAILGMKKSEIERKFDEIIAFAEVEKFIDTPIKHYSSGMHIRLGFAVAAHFEPEILLVDEVLSVGDAAFQKKCLGKMGDVAKDGRTVLFISHNMGAVRSLCSRAILLEQGKIINDGDPSELISQYLLSNANITGEGKVMFEDRINAPGGNDARLRAVKLTDSKGTIRSLFEVNDQIHVEIYYEIIKPVRGMRVVINLMTMQGEIAFSTTNHNSLPDKIEPGIYKNVCIIPKDLLNIGKYLLRIGADIPKIKTLFPYREYIGFQTVGSGNHGSHLPQKWPGVLCPKIDWCFEKVE